MYHIPFKNNFNLKPVVVNVHSFWSWQKQVMTQGLQWQEASVLERQTRCSLWPCRWPPRHSRPHSAPRGRSSPNICSTECRMHTWKSLSFGKTLRMGWCGRNKYHCIRDSPEKMIVVTKVWWPSLKMFKFKSKKEQAKTSSTDCKWW